MGLGGEDGNTKEILELILNHKEAIENGQA